MDEAAWLRVAERLPEGLARSTATRHRHPRRPGPRMPDYRHADELAALLPARARYRRSGARLGFAEAVA